MYRFCDTSHASVSNPLYAVSIIYDYMYASILMTHTRIYIPSILLP